MTRALRGLIFAGAVSAALFLSGCASDSSSVVGTWGDPDASGVPSIAFDADGKYAGTDGCNRVHGSWAADGDTINLGAMASTMMYCEGVDTWLTKSATARVDSGKLTFLDESGNVIGSLKPAGK